MSPLRQRIIKLADRVQHLRLRGQSLTEYVLIAVLLALTVGAALAATGPAIGNVFSNALFTVVQGTTTPYSTLSDSQFFVFATKVAAYQEPTQYGGNGNPTSSSGGGGGPNQITQTAIVGRETSTAAASGTGYVQTATQIAKSATATSSATATAGSATATNDRTPTVTPTSTNTATATVTFTPSITSTPTTASLPIYEQFDTATSMNDWQLTGGWSMGGIARSGSNALTFAPGSSALVANSATFIPLLSLNASGCPTTFDPILQFWSRWNLSDNITLSLQAGNYTGTSAVSWTTFWYYTDNQSTSSTGSLYYNPGNYSYNNNVAWRRFQVDLSSLKCVAGQSTAIRFTVGTTSTSLSSAWYVDDVAIYDGSSTNYSTATASGDPSACTNDSRCSPSTIDASSNTICQPVAYCGATNVKQMEFYVGGSWAQTSYQFKGDTPWVAGGFGGNANGWSDYQVPSDSIFQIAQPISLAGYTTTSPQQPVLDFWTNYTFPSGQSGTVEALPASALSSPTQTWQNIATFTVTSSMWVRHTFLLTGYDGQTIVIRFRLNGLTSATQTGQNWALSNLFIGAQNNDPDLNTIPLPFDDKLQSSANWTLTGGASGWNIDTSSLLPWSPDFPGITSAAPWTATFYHYPETLTAQSPYYAGNGQIGTDYTAGHYWNETYATTNTCILKSNASPCIQTSPALTTNTVAFTGNTSGLTDGSGNAIPLGSAWDSYIGTVSTTENFVANYHRAVTLATGTYYLALYSNGGSEVRLNGNVLPLSPIQNSASYPFTSDTAEWWDTNIAGNAPSGNSVHYYVIPGSTTSIDIDSYYALNDGNPPILQAAMTKTGPVMHSNAAGSSYSADTDWTSTLNGNLNTSSLGTNHLYMDILTRYAIGTTFTGTADPMHINVSHDDGSTYQPIEGGLGVIHDLTPYFPFSPPGWNTANWDDNTAGTNSLASAQNWHWYQVDLTSVATTSTLKVQFELNAINSSQQAAGWYIGEVKVCAVPAVTSNLATTC